MQADRALYQAKEQGRGTLKFHDPGMDQRITLRIALSRELRQVLERDELFVEYQPQVELGRGSITAVEALLRWRHPTRGLIGPSEFIPVLEGSGEIRAIGEWTLQTACREARTWRSIRPSGIPVSVNLSAVQFGDPDLPEMLASVLEAESLPLHLLELELTERIFLRATSVVEESLRKLHDEIGVGIALDDFGRGFSSLEYLCRFPIDKLKVDRFFVVSLEEESQSRSIVSAIIALANSLGLEVVAEGVETDHQVEFLRAHGCERAQGYYFSRPISSESLRELLGQEAESLGR